MSFTLFMEQSFLFISGDGGQKLNLSVSPNNSARGLFMHRETASLSSCGLRRTNETAEISVRQMFSSWIHVEDLEWWDTPWSPRRHEDSPFTVKIRILKELF